MAIVHLATVRFARLEDFEGSRYNRFDHVRMLLGWGELNATLRRD